MLSFWPSILILSVVQGAVVALPRALAPARLLAPARALALRGPGWALVPPASVIAFVLVAGLAARASAKGLTYLALVAVPPLAAVALAWVARPSRLRLALLVAPLFALAWADRGGLAGEGAALALTALSCVALGALLAAVTPGRWLAAGIIAMSLADTVFVVADLLQRPNNALNAAHPAAGLPRLQSAVFGSAVMGYGDLFIAGALGGLLAVWIGRRAQLLGAAATAALAMCFDLLFLAVKELPATVPVAAALVVTSVVWRRRSGRPRSAAAPRRPRPRRGRARAPAVR
jgi:hypothetical protein